MTYLFKSNPPTCKFCYKPSKVNKLSKSMEETLRDYKPLREQFLLENQYCQLRLNNCTIKAVCVHHKQGKATKELYLDTKKWMASCISCNNLVFFLEKKPI